MILMNKARMLAATAAVGVGALLLGGAALPEECETGGDSFPCGGLICTGDEYCQELLGGPAGSEPQYSCNPIPDSCAGQDTCDCLVAADLCPVDFAAWCEEPADGGATCTVALP